MALVTGYYLQSDGTPFPASKVPQVHAVPSKPFFTLGGETISQEPQTVTPNPTTGAYTFDLEPTINALERGVHYRIVGDYLDPNGYTAGQGHGRKDFFEQKIVVPLEGGNVGELTVVDSRYGLVWEGSTPPPMSMNWLYVDPTYDPASGAPLPVYTAPDGTTVEHGELVEWSA